MITYKDSGVDVETAEKLVKSIKPIAQATQSPEVISGIGGFNGMMALPSGYDEPVLVSSTDGVGTKLVLADRYEKYSGIGIDLVAMCVNDLITSGAKPLFFLDYYATGSLDNHVAIQVIESIANGCSESGMTLLGGETAEMPLVYQDGNFDLAGFAVGVVERVKIKGPDNVGDEDVIIGFESNGIHSNGFSLFHHLYDHLDLKPNFVDEFLKPTRLYTGVMNRIGRHVNAAAHITGGGLRANIERVVPDYLKVELNWNSWPMPKYCELLMKDGKISTETMETTFNCGIGFAVLVPQYFVDEVRRNADCASWVIGKVSYKD